ncbi:cupin domain-containing protein [Burkholderia metallica]|uniref:class I tRNA ligase family protein n=1 Tax=Burkholderia metallica TaxID=488729 RepID=UPI00157B9C98|nr:class I tRNA ligase family protein [Burkholderia metallica]NTZ87348.1 cupin domain-containing protein [Burkholderia metallica]
MKITDTIPEIIDQRAAEIHIREMVVAPEGKTRIHNHHDRECWSMTSGEGFLSSGDRHIPIHAGEHVEFAPFETHTITNRGSEELRFTARWFADWDAVLSQPESSFDPGDRLMIGAAFPSPNGPLHLGHLSGPFLMADILRRCCVLTGVDSFSYCGTFGNTNHIDRTAIARGTTYENLVTRSEDAIRQDLALFQAQYDDFLPHVPSSATFEDAKTGFIEALLASPLLVEREVLHPYSESEHAFVSESFVSGECPHCRSVTIGLECESCGLYQDECRLIAPFHTVTKEPLAHRVVKKLYLRLDHDILNQIASQIYSRNVAASRICYDSLKDYLENGMLGDLPVSALRNRGYPVHGDQVLSVVMERALRSYHGLSHYASPTRHLWFCGFDNLCASGILVPYVLKVLGTPDEQLPVAVVNQFSLLENRKFSTSANHAIWASEFLRAYPSDLARLYLTSIHRSTAESDFRTDAFFDYANRFVDLLNGIFANGQALASHYAGKRIEAGPWLAQETLLYRELNSTMGCCLESYAGHAPSVALRRVSSLLEAVADYIEESNYYRDDLNYLRTRLALVLYAYQSLAYCLYPVMPGLSACIMDTLDVDRSSYHEERHVVRIVERFDVTAVLSHLNQMKKEIQR